MTIRACFVAASGQNAFFGELHDAFRSALEQLGVETSVAFDHFPALADDIVYVFFPHEYFPLVYPEAHPTGHQMARAVVISAEQPGTHWFEENAMAAEHAGGVVDINRLGAKELQRRGIRARVLRLGYVPDWDGWGGNADSPRPIDFTFLGGYNQRRAKALALCSGVLKDHRSLIHLVDSARPHTVSSETFFTGERKWRHLASSKVILNVHRDERPYFEWQRMLAAAANGCLTVTEHSVEVEPLIPGEHFVSTTFESLPYAVAGLLRDEERIKEISSRTYEFLRTELPMTASIPILAETIEDVGRTPIPGGTRQRKDGHQPVPLPADPPHPPPYWTQLLGSPTEMDLVRMALKRLVLGQRQVERRIAAVENESEPTYLTTTFGPYDSVEPHVTVAVSLYNYEGYIAEALSSVAVSDFQDFELVIIDDASTDDSQSRAQATIDAFPWLVGKFIARGTNTGLPAARNLAIEHARAEYVFILDADNLVYPHAFGRLVDQLNRQSEPAFAYGILAKFDAEGPYDLVSHLAWDPKRLRYGNYIDAMSMLRRSAVMAVGGYTTDPRLGGWEDLALWCAFAEAGMHGVLVPEILGLYRAGRHSMLSVTNIDASEAWSVLLERFPFLRNDVTEPGKVK